MRELILQQQQSHQQISPNTGSSSESGDFSHFHRGYGNIEELERNREIEENGLPAYKDLTETETPQNAPPAYIEPPTSNNEESPPLPPAYTEVFGSENTTP